jgi:poly(rC)-binding protein 2/3/4
MAPPSGPPPQEGAAIDGIAEGGVDVEEDDPEEVEPWTPSSNSEPEPEPDMDGPAFEPPPAGPFLHAPRLSPITDGRGGEEERGEGGEAVVAPVARCERLPAGGARGQGLAGVIGRRGNAIKSSASATRPALVSASSTPRTWIVVRLLCEASKQSSGMVSLSSTPI